MSYSKVSIIDQKSLFHYFKLIKKLEMADRFEIIKFVKICEEFVNGLIEK